jgi:hypothetical protein
MPVGTCKLCLKSKPLHESHFMPSGLYKYCRSDELSPVQIFPEVSMPTARELKHPLLCGECEDRLNRSGETWVIPLLADIEGNFPLYDLLKPATPVINEAGIQAYRAHEVPGFRYEDVTHFAMGIFWKGAIHPWRKVGTDSWIELGPYTEPIREFLLGGPFPEHVYLGCYLNPPPVKQISFVFPWTQDRVEPRVHCFYIPGTLFALRIGKFMRAEEKTCLYSQPEHPIIVFDVSSMIEPHMKKVALKSKKSQGLLKFIHERHALLSDKPKK